MSLLPKELVDALTSALNAATTSLSEVTTTRVETFAMSDEEKKHILARRAKMSEPDMEKLKESLEDEYAAFIESLKVLSDNEIKVLMTNDIDRLSREELLELVKVTRSRIEKDAIIIWNYEENADEDVGMSWTVPDFYNIETEIEFKTLRTKIDSIKTAIDGI